RAAAAARERAVRSRTFAEERAREDGTAESKARSLTSALEAAESAAGGSYGDVAARISELRGTLARTRRESDDVAADLLRLSERVGALAVSKAEDAGRRDAAVAERDTAAERFRHLCALGFPEDAGISLPLPPNDGIRATLEAARATAAAWPSLAHGARHLGDALSRLTEAVHSVRQTLGERADPTLETDDDIQVFAASLDGVRMGATRLHAALTAELERGSDDITTAERELFDTTFHGDVRRHLADRIRQATELVDTVNTHLSRVRTASQVAVRLVWRIHPDLPPETRAARDLLMKDPSLITGTDREVLHGFFRSRIEEARSKNTAATWEEQLAEVLDYTAWHQFVVELDRSNGAGRQLLTKKLHGALSGGEKAIALHLPLFAAVAAHYQAVPEAPRLILLDEVFVGVDATNRGQVFSLLGALDLDLVLTSDHEWCTYRELSGIAIHQLITGGDGDNAVTSARFVWNGTDVLPDGEETPV
ncbi:SbcC/MukB-like Walker B domain-containing protein, partial [Streptomyces sp. 8N706]|uniref:SbcC/MukB-like Walker B domain-containing protein n=1 Tax=Streptomyces sp. 8N706 TaxID=3457416 RepID=UPI003FD473F2